MHRDAPFVMMVVCIGVAIIGTVAFCHGCIPHEAVTSAAHNADLASCRESSKAYRDAGPDAEWSAYAKCADDADRRDREGPK